MLFILYILVFLIGLVQTPIVVDLLRLLFPELRIKRLTSQLHSTLLIILMSVFAVITLGLQIFYFIPLVPNIPFRTTKLICHSVFAYWVWMNMVVNYYCAIFVQPGTTASKDNDGNNILTLSSKKVVEERSDSCCCKDAASSDKQTDDLTMCSGLPSSRQTHKHEEKDDMSLSDKVDHSLGASICLGISNHSQYCKVCQITVLYRDHHCPFTGNCVGLDNYSYFLLALCYATIGLGYSLVVGCLYFGECIFPAIWAWLEFTGVSEGTCSTLQPFTELFLPAVGGFVVLNIVWVFQIFLLLSDLTTRDVLKNFWKAPVFRMGCERIRNKRYLNKESRLSVLLLSRRRSVFWFLVPVRNTILILS